jgi:hypothetical protein
MKLTKMMAVSALILVAGFWVLTTSEFQHYKGLPGEKTDQYWWRHWIGGKNYGIGLIWAVNKSAAFGKVQSMGLVFSRARSISIKQLPETPADNSSRQLSEQGSEQGYKMYPDIWAIHRMDGIIYQSDYGSIGRVLATESGSKFNISIDLQGVRGYILRNGEQYDFYSAAGDRIGRILPCRWDGNGNGWDIFTTTQGYIGHIDRQGDWILGVGCSLMIDLNTLHDYYIKNTRKFDLPEAWPAGDGDPHPVGEGPFAKADNYVGTTMNTNEKDVAKKLAKSDLQNEVIRVMNGGHLPANWPTNPPAAGQMSTEEAAALQATAQQRLDALSAANGGQLPANWRELLLAK